MRFACLVYFDPKIVFDNSPASNAVLARAGENSQLLASQGFAAEALTLPDAAVTVRVRNGKTTTTDGPFAETKEVLGGFVLIEADSLADAARIAATNPMAELGSVEVRPLVDFSQPRPVIK